MTDRELLQQALDALITAQLEGNCEYGVTDALRARLARHEHVHANDMSKERVHKTEKNEHKPVAWVSSLDFAQPHFVTDLKYCTVLQHEHGEHLKYIPVYTAPPKKEWIGLTNEEIKSVASLGIYEKPLIEFTRAIEAKLKEKNND